MKPGTVYQIRKHNLLYVGIVTTPPDASGFFEALEVVLSIHPGVTNLISLESKVTMNIREDFIVLKPETVEVVGG